MARKLRTFVHFGLLLLGTFLVAWATVNALTGTTPLSFPESLTAPVLFLVWGYQWAINKGQAQPGGFLTAGLKDLFQEASEATGVQCRQVRKATGSVKILDTYFGNFDHFQASIGAVLSEQPECQVQILLARPGSAVSAARGELYPASDLDDFIRNAVKGIEAFRTNLAKRYPARGIGERLTIQYFKSTVPGPLVIIDDRHVFVGSFLQTTGSQNTPMFQFDRKQGLTQRVVSFILRRRTDAAREYVATFDRLWGEA